MGDLFLDLFIDILKKIVYNEHVRAKFKADPLRVKVQGRKTFKSPHGGTNEAVVSKTAPPSYEGVWAASVAYKVTLTLYFLFFDKN